MSEANAASGCSGPMDGPVADPERSGPALASYRVLTYDPCDGLSDEFDWFEVAVVSLWQLRRVLREVYSRGYERDLSVFVERVEASDTDPVADDRIPCRP